jgi:hypothetical protein
MASMAVRLMLVLLLAALVAGCSAIAGIFKAGVWVGAIVVIVIIGLLFLAFGRG